MPEINRSDYNSNEAIARRVDALTTLACELLPKLRYNGAWASTALDYLKFMWGEFKPVASTPINAKIYEKEIVEIDAMFTKLFNDAYMQEKRASRYGKVCGADAAFLSEIYRLKSVLQVMGQRLGLGMSVRRFSSHDNHDDL